MMSYPDSPEAVALELFREITAAEQKSGRRVGRNVPEAAYMLDLFAECLKAANGDRAQRGALQ